MAAPYDENVNKVWHHVSARMLVNFFFELPNHPTDQLTKAVLVEWKWLSKHAARLRLVLEDGSEKCYGISTHEPNREVPPGSIVVEPAFTVSELLDKLASYLTSFTSHDVDAYPPPHSMPKLKTLCMDKPCGWLDVPMLKDLTIWNRLDTNSLFQLLHAIKAEHVTLTIDPSTPSHAYLTMLRQYPVLALVTAIILDHMLAEKAPYRPLFDDEKREATILDQDTDGAHQFTTAQLNLLFSMVPLEQRLEVRMWHFTLIKPAGTSEVTVQFNVTELLENLQPLRELSAKVAAVEMLDGELGDTPLELILLAKQLMPAC
jgi:hypothetical protein